ncbi:vascular endothelial growth factor receptor 1 isoform X3 [Emydura macquarii macquarii]
MGSRALAGAMLCALLAPALLLAGSSSGSKFKGPELSIKGAQHVIRAGQTLNLTCRGEMVHSWSLPEAPSKESKRLKVIKYACGRNGKQFCSSLTLSRTQANDTGYYRCKYPSSSAVKKKTESTVYIFINDTGSPFVELHSNIPKIIHMTDGGEMIIPCRVTAPDIAVTLKKIPLETLIPDGKTIIWDSTKGFIIPKATYKFIGLMSCETTIDGNKYSTKYLTHRQTNTIFDVQLNTPNLVKLLKGDSLAINCTVSADWNTRVQMTWSYPGEVNHRASITKRIGQNTDANIFYSILVVDKVRDIDKGQYTCHVKSGPSVKSVNTTVHVYDKAFITLNHRRKSVLEAVAGRKSYRLSMKVKAFPAPEVVWLKDGLPAAEKCARYVVKDYSLIIRDVAEEDAGNYTITLSIRQWNLYKNLTVTLIVNVKPQIYEKAVSSFPDPNLYLLGSKQVLTCTVYGIPQPKITWIWHPCRQNHSKAR